MANVITTRSTTRGASSTPRDKNNPTPSESDQAPSMGKKPLKKARKDQGNNPKAPDLRNQAIAENEENEASGSPETMSPEGKTPEMGANQTASANQMVGASTDRAPVQTDAEKVTNESPEMQSRRVYSELMEARLAIPNVRQAGETVLTYVRCSANKWRERADRFPKSYNHGINPYVDEALRLKELVKLLGKGVDYLDPRHPLPETDDEEDEDPPNREEDDDHRHGSDGGHDEQPEPTGKGKELPSGHPNAGRKFETGKPVDLHES
ncbi:hypothetical protein BJ138DRAFT_1101632 [Hygrophoropsis aurantiaca]|uniref:Uncharacterized protein n=1 Tax=Hygrophoropsis aurantiaca TaxID=72124 RepID=A0ACB8ACH9_9AGAM|nr:hypothetical protein BJ138DRAFT_1101632 [Hygrophoropsis aurantiaca]